MSSLLDFFVEERRYDIICFLLLIVEFGFNIFLLFLLDRSLVWNYDIFLQNQFRLNARKWFTLFALNSVL